MSSFTRAFGRRFHNIRDGVRVAVRPISLPTLRIPRRVRSGILSTVITYRSNILHGVPSVPGVIRASSGLTVIRIAPRRTGILVLTHDSDRDVVSCIAAVLRDYFGVTNVGIRFNNHCNT